MRRILTLCHSRAYPIQTQYKSSQADALQARSSADLFDTYCRPANIAEIRHSLLDRTPQTTDVPDRERTVVDDSERPRGRLRHEPQNAEDASFSHLGQVREEPVNRVRTRKRTWMREDKIRETITGPLYICSAPSGAEK